MRSLCACCLLAISSAANAAVYPLPGTGEDLIGESTWIEAGPGDDLATIAYRQGLGFRQVVHANPQLDPWKLHAHQRIALPTQMLLPQGSREGIVVNVPEMRLYFFPGEGKNVFVYPVAVGRLDWKTPLGTTQVTAKVRAPTWYPPQSIRVEHAAQGDPLPDAVPPGEDNPLGTLALRLSWPLVLIHGTNKPMGGIGMPVTHGCIRLYPQDIDALFEQVAVGTPVRFIDQPFKLGRHAGRWLLEAHAALAQDPLLRLPPPDFGPALIKMKTRAGSRAGDAALDTDRIAAVLRRSDGLPALVEKIAPVAPHHAQARARLREQRRNVAADAAQNPLLLLVRDPLLLAALLLALGLLVVLALLTAGRIRRRLRRREIG